MQARAKAGGEEFTPSWVKVRSAHGILPCPLTEPVILSGLPSKAGPLSTKGICSTSTAAFRRNNLRANLCFREVTEVLIPFDS